MKFSFMFAVAGFAGLSLALPAAASAQGRITLSVGSGSYVGYDGRYDDSGRYYRYDPNSRTYRYDHYDRQHDRLEDEHEDSHDDFGDYHEYAHEQGVSRREDRRLHRRIEREHDYRDYELERQHHSEDRRSRNSRSRYYRPW